MVHFFDSDIAQKYGVNAAVLACFLWDCIEEQSTQSPRLHEEMCIRDSVWIWAQTRSDGSYDLYIGYA